MFSVNNQRWLYHSFLRKANYNRQFSGTLHRRNIDKKCSITWEASDQTIYFEARPNQRLRTAALRSGVVSPHNGRANIVNCRGLGTCGTCAVRVVKGAVQPAERTLLENARLGLPPFGTRHRAKDIRLACQIRIDGDLVVTKYDGFWGQGGEQAFASAPTLPFGEAEYIFDGGSNEDVK